MFVMINVYFQKRGNSLHFLSPVFAEAWDRSKTDCAYEGLNALCEKLGHLDGWPLPLPHLMLAAWCGMVLAKLMIIINFKCWFPGVALEAGFGAMRALSLQCLNFRNHMGSVSPPPRKKSPKNKQAKKNTS